MASMCLINAYDTILNKEAEYAEKDLSEKERRKKT